MGVFPDIRCELILNVLRPEGRKVHEKDSRVYIMLDLEPLAVPCPVSVRDGGNAVALEIGIVELLDVAHDKRVAVDIDKAVCLRDERRCVEPVESRLGKVLVSCREQCPELLREHNSLHRALVLLREPRDDPFALLADASVKNEKMDEKASNMKYITY